MKVVLPDSTELELPDGATGLDAARAIGPKLAEQAVLVRSNGRVQDVRLPLQDGEPVQFLTTRDVADLCGDPSVAAEISRHADVCEMQRNFAFFRRELHRQRNRILSVRHTSEHFVVANLEYRVAPR